MLNIEQHEYFGLMTLLAGLKVLIHHHQTPPLVSQLGFSVGPGTSTFAAVRKEQVRRTSSDSVSVFSYTVSLKSARTI